jgi:hypothetical protein
VPKKTTDFAKGHGYYLNIQSENTTDLTDDVDRQSVNNENPENNEWICLD